MSAPPPAPGATFRSLRHRNFRLFFAGQLVSQTGTWLSMVAQTLLALDLGASGTQLGLLTAAQFGPMLVLGAWAGAVADRVDKRRLLIVVQSLALASWAAADAYRGRPAGLPAAALAVAAVVVVVLVAADRRPRPRHRPVPLPAAVGASAAVALVAARTIGLAQDLEAGAVLVAAIATAVVLGLGWFSRPASDPVPAAARRSPG